MKPHTACADLFRPGRFLGWPDANYATTIGDKRSRAEAQLVPEAQWTPTPPARSTVPVNQLASVLVDQGMITLHEHTQLSLTNHPRSPTLVATCDAGMVSVCAHR